MRVIKLLSVLVATALLASCAIFGSHDRMATMSAPQLYAHASKLLQGGNYSAAETAYKRLISRFPSGKYDERSQVDLAYTLYKDAKPDDAYSQIDRFIKTYPTYKHIDYAYYLRGLINFNRTEGFLERFVHRDESRRDQGYRLKAFDDFSQLTRRFPGSKYAGDARQRMIYLRNGLAQHEIDVAEFYLQRKDYVAAAHRAKYVVEHYQQAPAAGDALAIMTRSYIALDRPKLAAQSRKVLKLNYPDHPYLTNPDWPPHASTLKRMVPFSGHN